MRSTALSRTPSYVLTGGLAILFLFPLIWSAVASVSPSAGSNQVYGYGLGNYTTLVSFGAGLPTYVLNSAAISIMTVCFVLAVSVLGGYSFAKFSFPGKNVLFLATLAILMVPYATLLIPLYLLHNFARTIPIIDQIASMNLVWLALVLGMFQLPFATFMMRISFESVPPSSRRRPSSTAPGRSGCSATSCCRPCDRASSRWACSRSLPPGTTSWRRSS